MVTFGPNPELVAQKRIKVYLRADWSAPWVYEPLLHPEDAVFCVGPSLPTATLNWDYGWWTAENTDAFAKRPRRPTDRVWCKIDYPADDGTFRTWIGLVDFQEDHQHGENNGTPDGRQVFTAFGLEKLLHEHEIDRSSWWNPTGGQNQGGDWENVDVVLPFNPRIDGKLAGNKEPGRFGFAVRDDQKELWSTHSIVRYMLERLLPRRGNESLAPHFNRLDYVGAPLPTWDEPELNPAGLSWHEALNRLVHRRRLFMSRWRYDEPNNRMELVIHTMTQQPITIPMPGNPVVPAATNQIDIDCVHDPLTSIVIRSPALEIYDQVVIRGARRVSVATFSHNEGTVDQAWTAAQEAKYLAGASGEAGYANWSRQKKERRNASVRNSPALRDVYARYKIPFTWNRKVKNGLNAGPFCVVFPDNPAGLGTPYPVALFHTEIEERLPLLAGVDYRDGKIAAGTVDLSASVGGYLPPLAFVKVATDDWLCLDKLGRLGAEEADQAKNLKLSGFCHVVPHSRHVRLDITGQPQHAIGGYSFTPLPADKKIAMYNNDDGLLFTLAVPDDRYCEGKFPATVNVQQQLIRRKYLEAGELYRQDYVVPQCVLGVADDGSLLRSTGGYLEKPGPTDSPHKLAALAKLAFAWYGQEHFVIGLTTPRQPPTSALELCDLVKSVQPGRNSQKVVNTSITEIRIASPKGTPGSQPPVTFSLTTWAGELDPFGAVPMPIAPAVLAQQAAAAKTGATP